MEKNRSTEADITKFGNGHSDDESPAVGIS